MAISRDELRAAIDRFPRTGLADLPTPLHDCPRFSAALGGKVRVLVKRDDLTGLAFGGNKTRKFELALGDAVAEGATAIVTGAASQSNHARQAAAAAAKLGMKCVLVNRHDRRSQMGIQGNQLLGYVLGADVRLVADGVDQGKVKQQVVEELQAGMIEECDFLQEARNLEAFNRFLAETGNTAVVAPRPIASHTTARVLTMERFHGVPLTDLEVLRAYTDDPAGTLVTALNTWFSSLMMCDFFHADLHAGNLMLLEDGRVGFIDFGMVGRIRRETWAGMMELFEAIGNGDVESMARAMAMVGMTREEVDVQALARDIGALQERLTDVDASALVQADRNDREVNQLLTELVRIGEGHGIRFPREFALLLKQFLYFDRYVQALAPELDMFNDQRVDMFGALDQLPGGDEPLH